MVLSDDLEGWDKGEAQDRGGINIYSYGWFALMYSRDHHNIVKKLSSNKTKIQSLKDI